MPIHPYVVLSAAASIDGYIDDATDRRLLLSNDEDFDRVDEVRTSQQLWRPPSRSGSDRIAAATTRGQSSRFEPVVDVADGQTAASPTNDHGCSSTISLVTDDFLPGMFIGEPESDPARDEVVETFRRIDPDGQRAADVFRATFDQLYDGQHTGRYRWEQLYKTEKTHFGTLLEINLRRAFDDIVDDGKLLDYFICGHDIDCKYSQRMGGWMLPPECFEQLLLVATANDEQGTWSLGVVRASEANRRTSENRDGKTSLNSHGRQQISWIRLEASLPPNVLLTLAPVTLAHILAQRSGQARVTELLRRVTQRRIGRNTIATLAKQDDYMARVRDGDGARTRLRPDGYLIPGGDYKAHREVARQLGVEVPRPGEVISVRVVPAGREDSWTIELEGRIWRLAAPGEEPTEPAPKLPDIRKRAGKAANTAQQAQ